MILTTSQWYGLSLSLLYRLILDAMGAFTNNENVGPVITRKITPHIHETRKGPHIVTAFLSMEELKQVILAVSSSFPMLILSVNDVVMCVKCFELRSNTLYKFKDHYVHNHSSKQGQIPYLHDILNKSQGKHSLKPNYYHLFFKKKKEEEKEI